MDPPEDTYQVGISIHAPAKGATEREDPGDSQTLISIHAPVKGATCSAVCWLMPLTYFNPRSREGSDNGDG